MSIRVGLFHQTTYRYDRNIELGAQVIRLRPAAHCRTPIESYSLSVSPSDHFLNWMQDPYGNFQARCVFPERVHELVVTVDLVANLSVINPFDFFLEPDAEEFPFSYPSEELADLPPYFARIDSSSRLDDFVAEVDQTPRRTIDFIVDLNQLVHKRIDYIVRMEPGVQTPDETLEKQNGSCRDSAWLLVQVLRRLGFAARFVSGYLIQLTPDQKSLDGPSGTEVDFTDLHAWTEVFLPGAGWIGLDPTSGLFAGEGHIPLACAPQPTAASPITGSHEKSEVEFDFEMSVTRIHEDPRVTKPYTDEQWSRIEALGHSVDQRLLEGDVRLTMGGEPTFVSIDDMDGGEWQTEAVGPMKKKLSEDLLGRLKNRFSTGGLLHHGQGKWYPGEPLPRWAMSCFWRRDGEPIWQNENLLASSNRDYGHTVADAERFAKSLAARLNVNADHTIPAYEDVLYYLWRERRLPVNVDLQDPKLDNEEERLRLTKVFEQGVTSVVGTVLPLRYRWWDPDPSWESGCWYVRSEDMFLIPGDSAMGYRLPMQSLFYEGEEPYPKAFFDHDPLEPRPELPAHAEFRDHGRLQFYLGNGRSTGTAATIRRQSVLAGGGSGTDYSELGDESGFHTPNDDHADYPSTPLAADSSYYEESGLVRTALCTESREGKLHVFLPPIDRLEVFLDLIAAIEATAEELNTPVILEGYLPPHDSRLEHFRIAPDPGVIEVNVHPAKNWEQLVDITTGVYADARLSRLGTEKFDLDGTHTGTGGGNHVVLGGPTPADSPWLRRPDLLRSFVSYWNNHPSLSYLFSGKFIGPTSQAPRVDEARADSLYELKIACEQVKRGEPCAPWLADRIFRHLLTDGTGNTHRAEFCIDKLYSPDSATGRLGLVEFRAFEMPPHAKMSLTQQLLLRALLVRFWEDPYEERLVSWGTSLHDRFMLPHFVWQDFCDVIEELNQHGFELDASWFDAHFEFRYPRIGQFAQQSILVELRSATEPWYVLGEEQAVGAQARYVDSSVERMQVKVSGMTDPRHVLTCNGRRVPLQPTGVAGQFVAGIRYRAWQPPSCLHPTIPVDSPLTFDLLDQWMKRSIGGCQYHVSHPGGLNPTTFPVNAFEAESRRATRFTAFGHTPGKITIPADELNAESPLTLDLRRNKR